MHATNNSIQAHVQEEKRVLVKSLEEEAETRYQEVGVQIRMCMHNAPTGIKSIHACMHTFSHAQTFVCVFYIRVCGTCRWRASWKRRM
jgi:hypothetical protein